MATKNELVEQAGLEGELAASLDMLGDKDGDVTFEDLRALPGTEDLKDDELQKLWDDAQKGDEETAKDEAEAIADAVDGTVVQTPRGYKIYDDAGKEIVDLTKISASDLLDKMKFGYKANGNEHRKSMNDLLRTTSFGHVNEAKVGRLEAERNAANQRVDQLAPLVERLNRSNAGVKYAMTQYAMGNADPLAKLLESFKDSLGREGLELPAHRSNEPEPTSQLETAGLRIWHEEIRPAAHEVADRYGAIREEVEKAIQDFIEKEPAEGIRAKVDAYLKYEIPLLLENAGYRESAPAAKPVVLSDFDRLKAENAAMKSQLDAARLEMIKKKNSKLPGSGRSDAAVELEEGVVPAEAIKSRDAMRAFLRS